jgi:4-amino-4-deoxy-L-arabinose transferase-like glycosyltransferase
VTGRGAAAVALALLLALPLLAGLGRAGFDDPGEGMHAEIAREMLRSGDPFLLTLNGVPYLDKPPLLYWLQALAFALAGPGEGPARLVPALGALVAVGATAWLGARLLGAAAGLLAGVALLTSPLFLVFARYVRPETLFVAALAGGFALALVGLEERRRGLLSAGLVAFGVAGLAKDPLGALAPLGVLALALALAGRSPEIRGMTSARALAVCLALGVGWWLVAEARTPGAVWYTVVDNKVLNVAGARLYPDEDVPLSAPEFLVVAVLGALPWSFASAVALAHLVSRRTAGARADVPWTALAVWAVGLLALTALSRFRLPHYGLPAYPALALLAARAWREAAPRPLAALHAAVFAVLAAACALGFASDGRAFEAVVAGATDVASRKAAAAGAAPPFPPWAALRPLVGQAAVVLGAGALLTLLAAAAPPRWRRVAPAIAVAATMLALAPVTSTALALVADHRSAREVGRLIREGAGAEDLVVHEGPIEGSGALEWYSGRRPVIVDGRRSVLAFGATRPEARDVFWTPEQLRAAWGERCRRVWLVTTRPADRTVAAGLPGAALAHARGGRRLYVLEALGGGRPGPPPRPPQGGIAAARPPLGAGCPTDFVK